jgi:hypothetical protein
LPFRFYTLKDLVIQYAIRGHKALPKPSDDIDWHAADALAFDMFVPNQSEFTTGITLFREEMGALGFHDRAFVSEAKDSDIICFFGLKVLYNNTEYTISCVQHAEEKDKRITRNPVVYITNDVDN